MHLFDRPAIGDEVWAELEELLIAADVGVSTTEKLVEKVKQRVAKEKIDQGSLVRAALQDEMVNILRIDRKEEPVTLSIPRVMLVVGVNGGGKTTSIAKLAYSLKNEGKSVILVPQILFGQRLLTSSSALGEGLGLM